MKYFFISILIASITLSPLSVSAQTTTPTQRFQPSTTGQRSSSLLNSANIGNVVGTVVSCTDLGNKAIKELTKLALKSTSKLLKGAAKGVAKFFGFGDIADAVLDGGEQAVKDKTAQGLAKEIREKEEQLRKKEYCWDKAAYTVSQAALGQLSNKTLNWVNTGFGGNPFYVRDIDSFLGSIKNEQVRDYLRTADKVNSADGDAVGSSVSSKILEMITGKSAPVSGPKTASEIKYDNFTKDFSTGGWDAWYRMTQLGENPIAGILSTSQQLGKNITQTQQKTAQELVQGSGFLNQKLCVEYAKADPDDDPALYQNNDGSPKCLKFETVTPGSVIAKQVEQITGTTVRQLEAADEINEALSRFFSTLINDLFNKGLQSLGQASNQDFGDFQANNLSGFGGTGSNIVFDSSGQPINGTGSGVIPIGSGSGQGYDTGEFDISNPRDIAKVIKTQKNFKNRTLDSQAAMRKIPANLGHLDYCMPGPNLTWADGVNNNISPFQSAVLDGSYSGNNSSGLFILDTYRLSSHISPKTKDFFGKYFMIQNSSSSQSQTVGRAINNKVSDWLTAFDTTMQERFSLEALSTAFEGLESTTSGKAFARGFVRDALTETVAIPEYIQAIADNDDIYIDNIAETDSNIPELESIRAEVLEIVTTARNRHIAAKRAQGITVNMTCLNEAYDISNNPIVGSPREESDATAELNALENAQTSFYNNL